MENKLHLEIIFSSVIEVMLFPNSSETFIFHISFFVYLLLKSLAS